MTSDKSDRRSIALQYLTDRISLVQSANTLHHLVEVRLIARYFFHNPM